VPERQHEPLATRRYTLPETLDCFRRNFWIFIQATVGIFPCLDPEQEGTVRHSTRADRWTWFLLPAWLACSYWSGFWGLLFWLMSPLFVFFFFELGNAREPGPRVWLPRWYVATLGVVLMLDGAPRGVRWAMIGWWVFSSFRISRFYSSDLRFYEQVRRENPNRSHYRIAGLGFLLLRDGRHSEAEDEFAAVLKVDPDNRKALLFTQQLDMNRQYTAAGKIGVGFTCVFCQTQALGLLEDGERLTAQEHAMFFFRVCPQCGNRSVWEA